MIDEALIESYVQHRRKEVAPASVNRELATLRRMLYLAKEWKIIANVPSFKMLPGERTREFVLSYDQEQNYLAIAPQPLNDVALLILDTGLRIGEAVALQWPDVYIEPVGSARFGFIRIRSGKSKNARRTVSLTQRVRNMLKIRAQSVESKWVFPGEGENAFLATSLDGQHARVRKHLGLSKDFVIHSLRHTMLTRLGEAGVDAFTIMRIVGHSIVVISQRYVHPSSEALERAFERLEAYNRDGHSNELLQLATFSATSKASDESEGPLTVIIR